MKPLGIILIVGGIIMCAIHGFSYKQEKNVVDLGSVQINKEENKTLSWPYYAGAIAIVAGVAVLLVGRKSE
jgi:hypothetical protein